GEEMVNLTLRTIRGEIKPVKSVYDCRVIQSFPTSIQPMRGLVDKIMALEGKNRVLSVSIAHCFYYGDVPECGARILVLTDDAKTHGDKLAEEIGQELIALREQAAPPEYSIDPKQQKILVMKSNQHSYASFAQIAAQVLYAEGDGPLPQHYAKLPWKKVQRPIWPLDQATEPRLII